MSELFDSLRREGNPPPRTRAPRTAHGEAVLATLGYTQVKRRVASPAVIAGIALACGVVGVCWAGWKIYDRSQPARSLAQFPASPVAARLPAKPAQRPVAPASVSMFSQPPLAAQPLATGSAAAATIPASPGLSRRQPALSPPEPQPRTLPAPVVTTPPPFTSSGSTTAPSSRVPPARMDPPASFPSPAADDLALALYYHRAGDFEKALQHYRILLQKNELNAQAHNNLGLLYQEQQLLQESSRELRRAILIEPRNAGARNNYGVTLLMQGRVDEATAQFRTILGADAADLDALVNLAIALRTAGQVEMAKETLVKALTIAPRNAAAHYNLGQLYDQINEPARAVEHYRTFLETASAEHAPRAASVRARIALLSRTPE